MGSSNKQWAGKRPFKPDSAQMALEYGAETSVLDWRERLVCSECDGREVDFVVKGTARR